MNVIQIFIDNFAFCKQINALPFIFYNINSEELLTVKTIKDNQN